MLLWLLYGDSKLNDEFRNYSKMSKCYAMCYMLYLINLRRS